MGTAWTEFGVLGVALALGTLALSLVGTVWTLALAVPVGLLGAFLGVYRLDGLEQSGAWGYWLLFWGLPARRGFRRRAREPHRINFRGHKFY